jgi:hypothetical protein
MDYVEKLAANEIKNFSQEEKDVILRMAQSPEAVKGNDNIHKIEQMETAKKFMFTKNIEAKLASTFGFNDSQTMTLKLILYFYKNGLNYHMSTKHASKLLTKAKQEWRSASKNCKANWSAIGTSIRTVQSNIKYLLDKGLIEKVKFTKYASKHFCFYPTKNMVIFLQYLFDRKEWSTQTESLKPAKKLSVEKKNTTVTTVTTHKTINRRDQKDATENAAVSELSKLTGFSYDELESIKKYSSLSEEQFLDRAKIVHAYMKRTTATISNPIGYFSACLRNEKMIENLRPTKVIEYKPPEPTPKENQVSHEQIQQTLRQMKEELKKRKNKDSSNKQNAVRLTELGQKLIGHTVEDIDYLSMVLDGLERNWGGQARKLLLKKVKEHVFINWDVIQSSKQAVLKEMV